mgnify:FL=1
MENLERYLEYLEYQKHYSTYTVDNYRMDLEEFFVYLEEEGISYLDLEYSDVRLYLMYLKDTRKLKASSIDRHLSALRGFYEYLEKEKKTKVNVFSFIKGPKKDKILPHYFEYNEIEELFSVNDMSKPLEVRNQLILELLYATGIRVSELVNIKLSDINKEERKIRIYGKGSKERYALYGDYAADVLDIYLTKVYASLHKHGDYLILNSHGNKITPRGVAYLLDEMIKKTSIHKNISPHMLRHTFATHLLNEGCDILSVQELLGHESLSSTQVYTHVSKERLKEVYESCFPRR